MSRTAQSAPRPRKGAPAVLTLRKAQKPVRGLSRAVHGGPASTPQAPTLFTLGQIARALGVGIINRARARMAGRTGEGRWLPRIRRENAAP